MGKHKKAPKFVIYMNAGEVLVMKFKDEPTERKKFFRPTGDRNPDEYDRLVCYEETAIVGTSLFFPNASYRSSENDE